jgi:hypothetical protein
MRLFSVAGIRADAGTGDVKVTETKHLGFMALCRKFC